MDKHSSLLRTLVNYGRKKFYNIGPRALIAPPQTVEFRSVIDGPQIGQRCFLNAK